MRLLRFFRNKIVEIAVIWWLYYLMCLLFQNINIWCFKTTGIYLESISFWYGGCVLLYHIALVVLCLLIIFLFIRWNWKIAKK